MSSQKSATRTRILEKTWRLMEKKRGHDVRIRDIAQAAGVSRQAVYLHFPSRADLLVATVRYVDEVKGVEQRVQRLRQAGNGIEALEAYVEFWGNYIPDIYGLAKALLALYEIDAAAAAAWDDRMAVLHECCSSVMNCLVRDRQLAADWNADQAADMLWTMLSVAHWEAITRSRGWSTEQFVSRMQVAMKRVFVRSA